MSYKITKDDEAYWLQIDGKKSALIRIEDRLRFGTVLDAVREAYEAEHPEEFRKPPRIYDYRDVELPEVQALIGHEVMASDNLYSLMNGLHDRMSLKAIITNDPNPFKGYNGISSRQFIRAIDEPPKILLTRAELIAIAAKSRGVTPEQIVVEE